MAKEQSLHESVKCVLQQHATVISRNAGVAQISDDRTSSLEKDLADAHANAQRLEGHGAEKEAALMNAIFQSTGL